MSASNKKQLKEHHYSNPGVWIDDKVADKIHTEAADETRFFFFFYIETKIAFHYLAELLSSSQSFFLYGTVGTLSIEVQLSPL